MFMQENKLTTTCVTEQKCYVGNVPNELLGDGDAAEIKGGISGENGIRGGISGENGISCSLSPTKIYK
jgi:hypothetical protein